MKQNLIYIPKPLSFYPHSHTVSFFLFLYFTSTIFYCIWCHPVWTTWTVEGVIPAKATKDNTHSAFIRRFESCVCIHIPNVYVDIYRWVHGTFQTYQQLQLILLALTWNLMYTCTAFMAIVPTYIDIHSYANGLGIVKFSKALISVYTINRKMGLKVCVLVGKKLLLFSRETFIYMHAIVHGIYYPPNPDNRMKMIYLFMYSVLYSEIKKKTNAK